MRRFGRGPLLRDDELATAWQLVSLLLDYPSEGLGRQVPVLRQAAASLPHPVGRPLLRFLDQATATPVRQLERDYVETFDITRKCCLYLSYAAFGDTRRRGVELVRIKQAYRKAGVELDTDELPDHLCVVLEFGAAHDRSTAWKLLNRHRAGIEMLRIALAERNSPWHDVVLALTATLPELEGDDEQVVARLVAQGPPREDVGLDLQPYATGVPS
jgi:nitrate reductase delta subunit